MPPSIKIKRIYDEPLKKDGFRILVDKLWPRGMTKTDAVFSEWNKDLAPSPGLRKWFAHDPAKWGLFQKKYTAELQKNKAVDAFIETYSDKKHITLVYAAKDEAHNHALVLQQFLEKKFNGG